MITTINQNGVLEIEPENELEGYALGRWCKENKDITWDKLVINTRIQKELQETA